jgi:hypothetical protein
MFPVRSPKQESVFEISELELECIWADVYLQW